MARPRLGEAERRTRTVGVRVTEVEAEELQERAQAARLSMGAYLRRRALGQRVRITARRDELSVYYRYRGEDWYRLTSSVSEERMEQVREFDGCYIQLYSDTEV